VYGPFLGALELGSLQRGMAFLKTFQGRVPSCPFFLVPGISIESPLFITFGRTPNPPMLTAPKETMPGNLHQRSDRTEQMATHAQLVAAGETLPKWR